MVCRKNLRKSVSKPFKNFISVNRSSTTSLLNAREQIFDYNVRLHNGK